MPSYESDERLPYEMKLMYVDPAGKGADEMGIAILYSLNTRIYIKKITGMQTGYTDESFMNIVNLARLHGIDTLVTEDNYGDGSFGKMLEPFMIKYLLNVALDGVKVKGQKEAGIINRLEPLLNQHRIVIDKIAIENDAKSSIKYSFTYQLSHITYEHNCLPHDDRLDAVEGGVSYMLDFLGDNESKGMETYNDLLMEKMMNSTSRIFAGMFGNTKPLNYKGK